MSQDEWAGATRFALVVVNYGSSRLLAENLAGLDLAQMGGRAVIVDNFTTTAEQQEVRRLALAHQWSLLPLATNAGFGAAVNAGARLALTHGASALAVLNPDAAIDLPNLERLVAAVAADPALMASPVMKTSSGGMWFDGMKLYSTFGRVASERRSPQLAGPSEPWLTGACFAMSSELWLAAGGFDEDYFLYWEDVDLSRRVVAAGGSLAVMRDALAVHDSGGTQTGVGGDGTKSEIYYFYNVRNRLVYAAKHTDGRQLWAWLLATPREAYEVLRRGGRRQLLTSISPLRAYVRGILSGALMVVRIRRRARRTRRSSHDSIPAPWFGHNSSVEGQVGT